MRSIAVFGNGRFVASGGFDQTARVWDLDSLREVARLNTDSMVTTLATDVRSMEITIGEMTGRVHVFQYET